jgi:hypothetical protein
VRGFAFGESEETSNQEFIRIDFRFLEHVSDLGNGARFVMPEQIDERAHVELATVNNQMQLFDRNFLGSQSNAFSETNRHVMSVPDHIRWVAD